MAREEMVWTTKGLLDELAARKNLSTDYQLAKRLGVSQASVSAWRKGARWMSDGWGIVLAQELELDPAYVCLCLATERSPDASLATQMRTWLVQHASAAMIIFAVFSVLSPTSGASPAPLAQCENDSQRCILCKILGARFIGLSGRFLSAIALIGMVFDHRHICAAGRRIDRPARLSVTA